MAKTRKELQADFLAQTTYNARRFNMQSVGVDSLDKAAKEKWPKVTRLTEGTIFREEYVPMPKFKRVADPELIHKMNEGREK